MKNMLIKHTHIDMHNFLGFYKIKRYINDMSMMIWLTRSMKPSEDQTLEQLREDTSNKIWALRFSILEVVHESWMICDWITCKEAKINKNWRCEGSFMMSVFFFIIYVYMSPIMYLYKGYEERAKW